MKKLIFLLLALPALVAAQHSANSYQYRKANLYEELGVNKNDIVFIGSDITDNGEPAELFGNKRVVNRGIRGETTSDMLRRLEGTADDKPRKIFIMPGIDGLQYDEEVSRITGNTSEIIKLIRKRSPRTQIYFISIPFINTDIATIEDARKIHTNISAANSAMETVCKSAGETFIYLDSALADNNRNLRTEYTTNGIHLSGEGYMAWRDIIKQYLK